MRPFLCVVSLLSMVTAAAATTFTAQTVGTGFGAVNALDTGELAPLHAGVEVVVLDPAGSVHLALPGSAPWPRTILLDADDPSIGPIDRPTVEAGELIADAPGDEVAVMSALHLEVLSSDGLGGWTSDRIADFEGYVGNAWGARIGDYRPSNPGEEIFLIYEGVMDFSTGTVFHHDGLLWHDFIVYSAEVGMDSAAGELDASHAGAEFIVTTEMGPTYQLHEAGVPPPNWPAVEVWNDMYNAGWVCAVADVDATTSGNEIVYGSRYSNSIMVSRPDGYGGHSWQIVFVGENETDPRNIWDMAVGDVLPETPEAEIVGVDDSGRVYLVRHDGDVWLGETIWTDARGAVNAVCIGDFAPSTAGDEILIGDAVGHLVLLTRDDTSTIPPETPPQRSLLSDIHCSPNPFNPAVTIGFDLAVPSRVSLSIYTVDGALVRTVADEWQSAGPQTRLWRGCDEEGRALPSGPYVYLVRAGGETVSGVVTLVR